MPTPTVNNTTGMPPGLVSRKIPSQNVVTRLMYREMFGSSYRLVLK